MRMPSLAITRRRISAARLVAVLLTFTTLPIALDLAAPTASASTRRAVHIGRVERTPAGPRTSRRPPKVTKTTKPARRQHRTPAPAPAPAVVANANDGRPKGRAGRWIQLHAPGTDLHMTGAQRTSLLPWIREYDVGDNGGTWVLLDSKAPASLGS